MIFWYDHFMSYISPCMDGKRFWGYKPYRMVDRGNKTYPKIHVGLCLSSVVGGTLKKMLLDGVNLIYCST